MTIKTIGYGLVTIAALLLLITLASLASVPAKEKTSGTVFPPATEYLISDFDSFQVVDLIDREVSRAGGDLQNQSMRLALGIATGGFGRDPVAERAMRDVGAQLLNHFMVKGDHVSLFGYEMGLGNSVWDVPFGPESRSQLAETWWNLKPGAGGIDFNHVIQESLAQLPAESGRENVVLALLSPHNVSVTPQGVNPPPPLTTLPPNFYESVKMQRLDPISIPYVQRQGNARREIFVTLVLPRRFNGPRLHFAREATLKQPGSQEPTIPTTPNSPEETPQKPKGGSIAAPLLLALALGLVGGALILKSPVEPKHLTLGMQGLATGTRSFEGPWKKHQAICRIVGPNVEPREAYDIEVGREGQTPSAVFATVERKESGVAVIGKEPFSVTGEGLASSRGSLVAPGAMKSVTIRGSVPLRENMPNVDLELTLEVTLK